MAALKEPIVCRQLNVTNGTFVGLAPHDTQKIYGDFIILGGQVPYVVRKKEGGKCWFIREWYIHNVQDGEVMKLFDENKESLDDARLQIELIISSELW